MSKEKLKFSKEVKVLNTNELYRVYGGSSVQTGTTKATIAFLTIGYDPGTGEVYETQVGDTSHDGDAYADNC